MVPGAVPAHCPVDVPRAGRGDEVVVLPRVELHGVWHGGEGPEGQGEDPDNKALEGVLDTGDCLLLFIRLCAICNNPWLGSPYPAGVEIFLANIVYQVVLNILHK